jgi:hypothetical protein
MTEQSQALLTIESFEEFEAGNSGSFVLEEGSYDGAIVCGYTINKANFEGKERSLVQLIWQLVDEEGNVHTLRGNGWTISSNEKSKMRIELSKWFDTQDWAKVCEILVKGGILVKHADGGAHFNFAAFIGKRGKLLVAEKASKKGSKYNVISSISPTKKKGAFTYGEVPWFLVEGDDIVVAKLADGIQIRRKEQDAKATAAINPMSPVFGATATQPVAQQPASQYVPPAAPIPQPVAQPVAQQATIIPDPTDDLPF